jgi:hypothetical protein
VVYGQIPGGAVCLLAQIPRRIWRSPYLHSPTHAVQVMRAADAALDAIAAGSEEWGDSVRRLKFEAHNRDWLQVIHSADREAAAGLATAAGLV